MAADIRVPTSKVCLGCHVDKPLEDFHRHACCKFGRNSRCRACSTIEGRERNQRLTANGKRHPYRNDIRRRHKLKKQFGMTEADFAAMLLAQQGVCAICKRPEAGTSGIHRTKRQIAVDHDHKTGIVRGLLCHGCNTGLGSFKDDPALLDAAKAYLCQRT